MFKQWNLLTCRIFSPREQSYINLIIGSSWNILFYYMSIFVSVNCFFIFYYPLYLFIFVSIMSSCMLNYDLTDWQKIGQLQKATPGFVHHFIKKKKIEWDISEVLNQLIFRNFWINYLLGFNEFSMLSHFLREHWHC